MTEHFTRTEAAALAKAAGFEVRRVLGLRESVPEVVFAHGLIDKEVTALCNAAFKLGRNAGLEEAAKICTELAELNRKAMTDSMWQQEECAAAIESLKDNTP